MTELDLFRRLFAGRTDVVGLDVGGCARVNGEAWDGLFLRHLHADSPIGVYPLRDDHTVSWGCVDIDTGVEAQAWNLWRAFRAVGVEAWVEVSRSKGFHVWTFYEQPVPAAAARDMQRVACQAAGAPTKEINPKQTELAAGQVGNYVRLPYPHRAERQYMFDELGVPIPRWERWVTRVHPVAADVVSRVAALLPKQPERFVPIHRHVGGMKEITDRLSPVAWTVFDRGPLDGADRSTTLAKLAHLCRECDLSASEALAVVEDADRRWGKYAGRRDGAKFLADLVARAYR